jgi:hypothetical protein
MAAFDLNTQLQLINWGYALADSALPKGWVGLTPKRGLADAAVGAPSPGTLPGARAHRTYCKSLMRRLRAKGIAPRSLLQQSQKLLRE